MRAPRGFTCSTWDLFHPGHVVALQDIMWFCEDKDINLTVGLQTSIYDRPEKNKPIQTVFERYTQVEALVGSNKIVPYESEVDLESLLCVLGPHIRFLGEEYSSRLFTFKESYPTNNHFFFDQIEHDEKFSFRPDQYYVVYMPRSHTWSTSELRKRIEDAS